MPRNVQKNNGHNCPKLEATQLAINITRDKFRYLYTGYG